MLYDTALQNSSTVFCKQQASYSFRLPNAVMEDYTQILPLLYLIMAWLLYLSGTGTLVLGPESGCGDSLARAERRSIILSVLLYLLPDPLSACQTLPATSLAAEAGSGRSGNHLAVHGLQALP